MHHNKRGRHATERLAGEEAYSVDLCPCGCLHLHLGAITLRLSSLAFTRMAAVMGEAARILSTEAAAGIQKH